MLRALSSTFCSQFKNASSRSWIYTLWEKLRVQASKVLTFMILVFLKVLQNNINIYKIIRILVSQISNCLCFIAAYQLNRRSSWKLKMTDSPSCALAMMPRLYHKPWSDTVYMMQVYMSYTVYMFTTHTHAPDVTSQWIQRQYWYNAGQHLWYNII